MQLLHVKLCRLDSDQLLLGRYMHCPGLIGMFWAGQCSGDCPKEDWQSGTSESPVRFPNGATFMARLMPTARTSSCISQSASSGASFLSLADDKQTLFHPFSLAGCQGCCKFPSFLPSKSETRGASTCQGWCRFPVPS